MIIDLKLGEFTHADAGQMHLYLNYAREHWMRRGENPLVRLILCAQKDESVARYARSDRQSNVAFQNLLLEARPLARSPQPGDMRDAVAYRPAIRARAAADRPRDAHELGSHLTAAQSHFRVSVPAQVHELEVRRKLRVRERACALEVEAFRIFKARADAMP